MRGVIVCNAGKSESRADGAQGEEDL